MGCKIKNQDVYSMIDDPISNGPKTE